MRDYEYAEMEWNILVILLALFIGFPFPSIDSGKQNLSALLRNFHTNDYLQKVASCSRNLLVGNYLYMLFIYGQGVYVGVIFAHWLKIESAPEIYDQIAVTWDSCCFEGNMD